MAKYWFIVSVGSEKVTGHNIEAGSEAEAEQKACELGQDHYPSSEITNVKVGRM